ncbi:MAG: hypothetical protein ACRDRL_12440 [Sciscionella sp.]
MDYASLRSASVSTTIELGRVPVPPKVILVAMCWYLHYSLSYPDTEELRAEPGIKTWITSQHIAG